MTTISSRTNYLLRIVVMLGLAWLPSGCITPPATPSVPTPSPPTTTPPPVVDWRSVPDAVPRPEPLSKKGNPAFYEVFGVRYTVMSSAAGYVERGVASWYGPGFHAAATSNGEPYDMHAMTAAHKTLPLPCYVRVTNLANGKSVVVRVNDRGPFKAGRIIDLSRTAAAKLDMLQAGTALVEVRVVTAEQNSQTPTLRQDMYVQAGAFSTAANAETLAQRLRGLGYAQAVVRSDKSPDRAVHRVRIGPVADVASFDRIVAQLKKLGIADARLANE